MKAKPSVFSLSLIIIIIVNLFPLYAAYVWGEDIASMLFLYWSESVIIQFFTLLKMATYGKLRLLERAFSTLFILFHSTVFTIGILIFILANFYTAGQTGGQMKSTFTTEELITYLTTADYNYLFSTSWIFILAFFVSHAFTFFENFSAGRKIVFDRKTPVTGLSWAFYKRVIVIFAYVFFIAWTGLPLAVMIFGKTVIEVLNEVTHTKKAIKL
jgi:hypothetical protein